MAKASGKSSLAPDSQAQRPASGAAHCVKGETEFWTQSGQFLLSIREAPGFSDLVQSLGLLYLAKFGQDYPSYVREELFQKGKELFSRAAGPLREQYRGDFINTFEVFYNKMYALDSYPENMRDAKRLEVSVMLDNDFGPLIRFIELDQLFAEEGPRE